jgi:phospholipase/lecithinase/hemolysin
MNRSAIVRIALLLSLVATPWAAPAAAAPITSVISYGDSLSDNGNLFALTGYPPSPPYFSGRGSNGPVAVEQLALSLGVPLLDFAVYGATTGIGNSVDGGTPTALGALSLPGMAAQALVATGPGDLVVVWGGANDFFSPAAGDTLPDTVTRAVTNLVTLVVTLQALGAQQILVPGLPDLGLTPAFLAGGPGMSAFGSTVTDAFNAALKASLPAGVLFADTASLLRDVVANPSAYGLTNVTDSCFNQITLTVCTNPDQYMFWDLVHPTTAGHGIFAEQFEQTVVPEPSTLVLAVTGLALASIRRRRR